MVKDDLVRRFAQKTNITLRDAKNEVDAFFDTLTELMQEGGVNITGFGHFSVSDVEAREARNPKTGEAIFVPAKRKINFKPGKTLKEAVNE